MSGSAEAVAKLVADGTFLFVVRDERKLHPSFFIGQFSDDRSRLVEVTRLFNPLRGQRRTIALRYVAVFRGVLLNDGFCYFPASVR